MVALDSGDLNDWLKFQLKLEFDDMMIVFDGIENGLLVYVKDVENSKTWFVYVGAEVDRLNELTPAPFIPDTVENGDDDEPKRDTLQPISPVKS